MCLGWAEAAVGVPVSDVEVRLGSDARSGHTTEVGWGGTDTTTLPPTTTEVRDR